MTRVALKALWSRKLRTFLTGFAIVLGVATITGTYVLTDSISKAFDSIFSTIYQGTDAVVTGDTAFDVSEGSGVEIPSFDESLLPKIKALPEVDAAVGGVGGEAQLIGDDGDVIQFGGAPNIGFSIDPTQARFNSIVLKEGDWPAAGDVAVDTSTASKEDIEVGEQIGVQAEGPVRRLRVSGLFDFSSEGNIGGATLAAFDLGTAQQLFKKEGRLDQIRAAAAQGTTEAELLSSIRSVLPPGTQVRTGEGQASEDASETQSFLSFLQGFLLAFGGIALFVGAFVIANSLSITIAQRTREFATMRTIGASRRQIMRAVLVEAFVIGVIASVVGIAARPCPREGPLLALRAGRVHAPQQRPAPADANGDRGDDRRRSRNRHREPASRSPRDAGATDRRRPRGRGAAARTLLSLPARRLGAAGSRRIRAARLRVVRTRPLHVAAAAGHGRGHRADLLRRRVLLGSARHAARPHARRPGGKVRGGSGDPRARQRDAEPAAHRLDGLRAHDRARARHARRHAGGVHSRVVLRRRRQDLGHRLRGHGAEQLLTDPDQRGGAVAQRARHDFRRRRAGGRGEVPQRDPLHHRSRSRREQGLPDGLGRGLGRGHGLARRGRRVHRRQLCRRPQPPCRISGRGAVPGRRQEDVPDQGDLRSTDRRLAVRDDHDLERDLRRVVPAAEEPVRLRDHGGRGDVREHVLRWTSHSPASPTRSSRTATSSRTTSSAASARCSTSSTSCWRCR